VLVPFVAARFDVLLVLSPPPNPPTPLPRYRNCNSRNERCSEITNSNGKVEQCRFEWMWYFAVGQDYDCVPLPLTFLDDYGEPSCADGIRSRGRVLHSTKMEARTIDDTCDSEEWLPPDKDGDVPGPSGNSRYEPVMYDWTFGESSSFRENVVCWSAETGTSSAEALGYSCADEIHVEYDSAGSQLPAFENPRCERVVDPQEDKDRLEEASGVVVFLSFVFMIIATAVCCCARPGACAKNSNGDRGCC
jgi:hypothetical protein